MSPEGIELSGTRFANPLMARDFWSQGVETERVAGGNRVPGSHQESSAVTLSCGDTVETGGAVRGQIVRRRRRGRAAGGAR